MFDSQCCQDRQNTNTFDGNFTADTMNVDIDMMNVGGMPQNLGMGNMNAAMPAMGGTVANPIMEPMQERQVHRTIVHEVPHVCPVRTKIINHHIYRHTYSPQYSCCEENTCSNVQCGSCSCFR